MTNEKDFKSKKTRRIAWKYLLLISTLVIITGVIAWLCSYFNITSISTLQTIIQGTGILGIFVFCILMFLFMLGQVLPTAVLVITSVIIYGTWQGILISVIATLFSAILIYLIGFFAGEKILTWTTEDADKVKQWQMKVAQGKYSCFLLLLFPLCPDGLIYLLMGIAKLEPWTFGLILILSKPIGVIMTGLLAGGSIIPLQWSFWWIWAILGLIMVVLMWASWKYSDKIDKLFNKIIKK